MAKLKIKRIEILALIDDSKNIIDYLQRKGVVELTDYEENDALHKLSTLQTISMFEKFLKAAQSAQETLNKYVPQKKSILSTINGRKELSASEYLQKVDNTDRIMRKCHDINLLSKRIIETASESARTQALIDTLKPWLGLDIPVNIKATAETAVFIGSLPSEYTEESLLALFSEALPEAKKIAVEVIYSSKDQSCLIAFCHRENSLQAEQALREAGFIRAPETSELVPSEQNIIYEDMLTRLSKEQEKAIEDIKSYKKYLEEIEFLIDYTSLRLEKYESLSKLSISDKTFAVCGFIPECEAQIIAEEIERNYAAAVKITETDETDDPPVLLKNNGFTSPVESITEMYSSPGNQDVDPNPVMAFFYYCFFGMMLSDAGYGLLMVIAMLILKKKVNLEEKIKKTVNLFLYCGISTVFWGAMFGSWFGDIVQIVGKQFFNKDIPSLALWFEPVRDPMKLLLFAFLFGIIHLFVGLGVRFSMLWKDGKRLDAILDVIPVYLLILGAAPLCAGIVIPVPSLLAAIGKYLALAGASFIVLTAGRSTKNILGKLGGGLYGLYNIGAGYMGDILSYSRLLALGLSTGVVASVVNVLGTISNNMLVKGIMLVFVFIFGHSVNIAVNLIGSYVHTNRLQYVEFFSKFYEGGGKAFTPLRSNTKYYRLKEETNNG